MWVALFVILLIAYWFEQASKNAEIRIEKRERKKDKDVLDEWKQKYTDVDHDLETRRRIGYEIKTDHTRSMSEDMRNILAARGFPEGISWTHPQYYYWDAVINKCNLLLELSKSGKVPGLFVNGGLTAWGYGRDEDVSRLVYMDAMKLVDDRMRAVGAGPMLFVSSDYSGKPDEALSAARKVSMMQDNDPGNGYYFYPETMYYIKESGFGSNMR